MALIAYWPTILVYSGIAEFLVQVALFGPARRTLAVSVCLSLGALAFGIWRARRELQATAAELVGEVRGAPKAFLALLGAAALVFALAARQSLLPPHLPVEFDAINYHMALPRQHLLAGSLAHIPWSVADLWPSPIQWGFAPFWFAGETFHRIPQFLASVWAFGLLLALGRARAPGSWLGWIPALAVFTTYGVVLQLGTAMIDLPILYFLLAALHAWERRRTLWAALALAVFASAKAFSPFQAAGLLLLMGAYFGIFRRETLRAHFGRAALIVALAAPFALGLLSRSAVLGVERAGTPLFPFGVCLIDSVPGCQGAAGRSIRSTRSSLLYHWSAYGEGRGPLAFAGHLWKVSVPTRRTHLGSENEYNDPLGLAWPLWVVLLLFALARGRPTWELALALSCWGLWWLGSQQSRWLYPVLALGWLGTLPEQKRVRPALLCGALLVSAAFSLAAAWHAYRPTFFSRAREVQEARKARMRWHPATGDLLTLDILYADVPLRTHGFPDTTWVLKP